MSYVPESELDLESIAERHARALQYKRTLALRGVPPMSHERAEYIDGRIYGSY